MSKTILRYRTFDDVVNEASADLHTFNLEGMIEPGQLIKVALKINKELGLKINQEKECLIDIDHRKGKLPVDFYVANFALMMTKHQETEPVLAGRQTENVLDGTSTVYSECPDGNCAGFRIVEKLRYTTRTYTEFRELTIKAGPLVDKNCFNLRTRSANEASLVGQHIKTNFECGKLYLSYMGNMEDDDGNLLVLDHDIINEYYEYAFKLRILENLYLNGEDVLQKMQFIEEKRYKTARTNALSIANTPDFAELKAVHNTNRKIMYNKYYRMFQ